MENNFYDFVAAENGGVRAIPKKWLSDAIEREERRRRSGFAMDAAPGETKNSSADPRYRQLQAAADRRRNGPAYMAEGPDAKKLIGDTWDGSRAENYNDHFVSAARRTQEHADRALVRKSGVDGDGRGRAFAFDVDANDWRSARFYESLQHAADTRRRAN